MTDKAALRVVFRVDASLDIGTGHVIRCLTLADRLRGQGAEVGFVCREFEGHLCDLIEGRGFNVSRLPLPAPGWRPPSDGEPRHASWLGLSWQEDAEQTAEAIAYPRLPDWLVVDHYALDSRWEQTFRARGIKLLAIDDLADRSHSCNVLVDQNLVAGMVGRYEGRVPGNCTLLLGPTYAMLQSEYSVLRTRTSPREGPIRRVLVSFGGVDKDCLTEKTVDALLSLKVPQLQADVVLSSSSPQFDRIRKRIAGNSAVRLHDRVASLAPLILAADLAIGASGTTNWERFCLGLPAVVVTVADNQTAIAAELAAHNLVEWLGHASVVDQTLIEGALRKLLETGLDGTWSERCLNVVDGHGTDRVCAVLLAHPGLELSVRHAVLQDEALLLDWANDPLTRRNGFNPRAIEAHEHRAWFRARLRSADNCMMCIVETALAVPLGQVRFDRRGAEWEISYAVAPAFRGRGVGRTMLAAAIEYFRRSHDAADLFGQVKVENLASHRIFEALGFKARTGEPDRLIYELNYGR
ncbi:UDP-2,4-diacetamido-2,4,6-trideoxy-beta-L-altropyranose hydrolase [Rhizobiaceae bacterium n13]|uniref:UDP-2,4-diacetamido-2,4, 6-trideoxy-beta-L-altropyranose hydrolase n=1 Tax=Ferirhizobium litorale TaxID=2927786 RepID=A0AAE3QD00_9HYPH|nr:UDP-2,4-diacetamido-2,4,6-trideoxy-beta-L-altropyranose hydrolase [Fererhizobium litorale]MDI7863632.1 UDP-2,4-diacetamido-2,4,6-trideoxy-beta-L-altropyranose hydrolase [Fererhizobium litorale]MDI7923447.1 UDP-2,4-diacetamido-2,4,6-trideoxy-beta-L-altropyranose hydrolase [Fererhizobium litorale]